jgi:subtilisin family serine protease
MRSGSFSGVLSSIVGLFGVTLALAGLSIDTPAQKRPLNYVSDEVLVKFRPGQSKSNKTAAAARFRSTLAEDLGSVGWTRMKLPAGRSVDDALAAFRRMPDVETVQPNYIYRLQATPNDARWGSLYGMSMISAPAAWDIAVGDSSVVVADIDTGFDYTHEDLAANAWFNSGEIPNNGIDDDGNGFIDDYYGYDFRYNDPDPMDENGHGTHTAGTIGAVGNNALGVVGVAWHVKIMGIKIYSAWADDTTSAMLVNAYNYVRMMKDRGVNIRVTNNSYGGCPEACADDLAVKEGIDRMGDAGILNVFAAGNAWTNNDTDPFFPASFDSPSIVSVGGSDQSDNRIYNYGATTVDIAAPGSIVLSTVPAALQPQKYWNLSGTSMSSPHVAGAAALLAMYDPALSAASIKATLINTADVLLQFTGFNRANGRLNVARALQNQTVCSFSLSQNSLTAPTKGGVFTVNVTAAGQNCDYGARSDVKWLKVVGQDSFTGNGTVTFRVTVNPTITRNAVLTIAGQPFTVTQSRQ